MALTWTHAFSNEFAALPSGSVHLHHTPPPPATISSPTAIPFAKPPVSSTAPEPTPSSLDWHMATLSTSINTSNDTARHSQAGDSLRRERGADSPPVSSSNHPGLDRTHTSDLDHFKYSILLGAPPSETLGPISATSEEAVYDGVGSATDWSQNLRLAVICLLNLEFYRECFKRTLGGPINMKPEIGRQFELMLKLLSGTAFEAGVLVRRLAQHEDVWPFKEMPDATTHEVTPGLDGYKKRCLAQRSPGSYLSGDLLQVSADGVYKGTEGLEKWSGTLRLIMLCMIDLEWHQLSLESLDEQKLNIKDQVEILLKGNSKAVEECQVLLFRLAKDEEVAWPIKLRVQ
ncbi:hypothetical protein BDV98DRAFT_250338 [Pterulicium gracile]|uniref:Uncharacterized protein n=1 Tax=Pterulicium gracile TaxID=1884261 RepID=A0A5C3Q9A8_9AGAR|nr:hypothetical protein BDV98DRAFT_250338 [Pterula gracilis]